MMAIPSQYIKMIDGLLKSSRDGKVFWQETEGDPSSAEFYVTFEKFSAAIWKSTSNSGAMHFGLRDSTGTFIDTFWLTAGSEYEKLDELFDLARRSARRIDEAIAEISKELEGGSDIVGMPF